MNSMSAQQILDREFLELRAKILQLAASYDRITRAGGCAADDRRLGQLEAAVRTLLTDDSNRAEQVQLIFSREYADDWQAHFQLKS